MMLFITVITVSIFISSCDPKVNEEGLNREGRNLATLEKEIELRLREYERHLQNEDSIALGNMYMMDAEVIPSTVGRESITKVFGKLIRNNITGSSFKTMHLWGNDQLLVEEGIGSWSHKNGEIVNTGRYLLIWQKDNGEWKILRDTWFPDKKK